jgi:deoxyribose-phosphate aldolase
MINTKLIDHTVLNADATEQKIINLCEEAKKHNFMSVCINPSNIKLARKILSNSDVLVCTVIGFPLGANTIETKVFEAKDAIEKGAQEIDMVLNIARLKEQKYDYILDEISRIKQACNQVVLKVIIETALLDDKDIIKASEICVQANADFVKTSTGFAKEGATVSNVALIKKSVGNSKIGIKAAGGVKSVQDLNDMVSAGATRIGTSRGVSLITDQEISKEGY